MQRKSIFSWASAISLALSEFVFFRLITEGTIATFSATYRDRLLARGQGYLLGSLIMAFAFWAGAVFAVIYGFTHT